MKKRNCLLSLILACVMCLGVAGVATASENDEVYPVYVGGNDSAVGQAVAIDGVTYLPMRTIFENCNASVQWNTQQKSITAVRADGAVLTLDVNKHTASLCEQGETMQLSMPQEIFVCNNTTYLPLRFVAENLRCQVKWDNEQKNVRIKNMLCSFIDELGQVYLVDVGNGSFYQGIGSKAAYLANCGIAVPATYNDTYLALDVSKEGYSMPYDWGLEITDNGGYLLQCKYMLNGAVTHTMRFASYINPESKQVFYHVDEYDAITQQMLYQHSGNTISIIDKDDNVIIIDEALGNVKKYNLVKLLADVPVKEKITSVQPVAVDGQYIFFRTNWDTNLLMFDVVDASLLDFQELLIDDSVIAKVAAVMGIAENDKWWQNFGPKSHLLETGPYFHFVKLEDGMLYVELRTYLDIVTIPLQYAYR